MGNATSASCIVCEHHLSPWFERYGREVFFCNTCGHIQVPAGLARMRDGKSIYDSAESDLFEREGNADYYLDEGTADAARGKLAFVEKFAGAGGSLLDVGASFGHFLNAAGRAYDAYGIEVNARAVTWSRDHFDVKNFVGSVYEMPPEIPRPLRVVTAWDVIEHLDDPREALAACRKQLQPGGWLFLSTPDAGSVPAHLLGKRWYYQDPVQHINLFRRDNLSKLLTQSGFTVAGHTYFGRRYRINYVLQRLRYLLGEETLGRVMTPLLRLPSSLRESHVTIKLWDVMGIAAQVA